MVSRMNPNWRTPAGVFAILLLIASWAVLIATFADSISGWPILVQSLFYLVTGLVWIVPLKPLLRWMETGRWRSPEPPGN